MNVEQLRPLAKVRIAMSTMGLTKIVGSACAALLVLLMLQWGASTIYHVGSDGHGEEHASAYPIEMDDAEEEAAVEEGPSFADMLAEADVEKGAKVFSKCKACHKLEVGKNGVGPSLFGIVDRAIASSDGFKYSDVVKELGGNWGIEELNEFLTKPKNYAPGTKMSFSGLKKETDRANLISYLQTIK